MRLHRTLQFCIPLLTAVVFVISAFLFLQQPGSNILAQNARAASFLPQARSQIHMTASAGDGDLIKTRAAIKALQAVPVVYRVRPGDTLSEIAHRLWGHASDWPALWYANRHRNPTITLLVGEHLKLPVSGHVTSHIRKMAMGTISPSVVPGQPMIQSGSAPAPATGSVTPSSAYEACVIHNESGGNPAAVNPTSGAGGLYQFLPSTWASLGYSGLPQDAPPAVQQQAFNKLYAEAGSSPWVSDGC